MSLLSVTLEDQEKLHGFDKNHARTCSSINFHLSLIFQIQSVRKEQVVNNEMENNRVNF